MSATIRDLMEDPQLFGNQFFRDSFTAWAALLCGFYGLALNRKERQLFEAITKRSDSPQEACTELWLAIGRRGGKSQMAALLAVYESAFKDYKDRLSPGEVATVMVLAADRKQARSVFRYISGLLHSNPMLRAMIVREDREAIELNNRTVIEVHTASFRAVRGYSVACCIADEVAFWRSEDSANPDTEIINAIRPAMATLDGTLIALSSPYAKRGALWSSYRRYFGKSGPILVAQAESRTMNPTLPQRVVDEAMERDPASAAAEYKAQFRDDISAFISRDLVDRCTRRGPLIIPPRPSLQFFGFVDTTGGGNDEFTLSISFWDGERAVIAGLWAERGNPAEITQKYATILKRYRISRVKGDRYAADWPRLEFRKHGITLDHSEATRSALYLEMLPMLQTGTVELPPDDRAITQLTMLERRTGRSGKDTIDHPPSGHDDRANALAGAAWMVSKGNPLSAEPIKVSFTI